MPRFTFCMSKLAAYLKRIQQRNKLWAISELRHPASKVLDKNECQPLDQTRIWGRWSKYAISFSGDWLRRYWLGMTKENPGSLKAQGLGLGSGRF
ncbi:hypothetical protein BCT84_01860 [Vibrio breoganii]|nr:hypothetical protein BCT84_01860 [Vibrio breoganii]